jgi:hypothetical protein
MPNPLGHPMPYPFGHPMPYPLGHPMPYPIGHHMPYPLVHPMPYTLGLPISLTKVERSFIKMSKGVFIREVNDRRHWNFENRSKKIFITREISVFLSV